MSKIEKIGLLLILWGIMTTASTDTKSLLFMATVTWIVGVTLFFFGDNIKIGA